MFLPVIATTFSRLVGHKKQYTGLILLDCDNQILLDKFHLCGYSQLYIVFLCLFSYVINLEHKMFLFLQVLLVILAYQICRTGFLSVTESYYICYLYDYKDKSHG